jgi:hypothetical protein
MLILHDALSADLTHIQALAEISEGFALADYVRIEQADGAAWIGQITQPNQNLSTVSDRLDPTVLHGLRLMQTHPDIQSVRSVQVFDILILGQYRDGQLLTPRLRPLPGASVQRLNAQDTLAVLDLPPLSRHADGTTNAIGELLAATAPLCVDERKFRYHFLVAGGTGSGKSNVCANLLDQAVKYDKCVLVHDAKPDYRLIDQGNTDPRVGAAWQLFAGYNLAPHPAPDVRRLGFHGRCDPTTVDEVLGFSCSDFHPDLLAGLFFVGSGPAEQNAYEGFAGAAHALQQQVRAGQLSSYDLDMIMDEVRRRSDPNGNVPAEEAIHEMTGRSIMRKVATRRTSFPWLDAVGRATRPGATNRLRNSILNNPRRAVNRCDLARLVAPGRILIIDYAEMDDQSYAVLLSFFLRACQAYRKPRGHGSAPARPGLVQLVDEAHRIFDNDTRHGHALAVAFERVMREGRSVDHSIILSLQNASQVPARVLNNLNSKIVMRQNSKAEAEAAAETMGREFVAQALRLGTGHALVALHESRATVLAQMAPSPYELIRQAGAVPGLPSSSGNSSPVGGALALAASPVNQAPGFVTPTTDAPGTSLDGEEPPF